MLRKFRESANSPVLWYIYNLGKYKHDANLGSGRAMPVFSPPTLHLLLGPNRCAYYWREPQQSSFSFFLGISLLCAFVALSRSFSVVVFEATLIYHAKSTSTLENICLRRRVAWSGDECGIIVEGLVKGEPARGSVGKSAEVDETTFFLPLFRPFPFAICRGFFFLYACNLAFGWKYILVYRIFRICG